MQLSARWFKVGFVLTALLCFVGGCAQTRTVTISTVPPDATIRVDDRVRGRGPRPETFVFSGDIKSHTVTAEREGYKTATVTITPDYSRETLPITLKPAARIITFSVGPMPGIVYVDGNPKSALPVPEIAVPLEFALEPSGQWQTHKVRVERENWVADEKTLKYEDLDTVVKLELKPLRRDLQIDSVPRDAEVSINGKVLGNTLLSVSGHEFPIDKDTDNFVPQKVTVKKNGYFAKEETIGWEAKSNYAYTLEPQSKKLRIFTEPRDAVVKLGGRGTEIPLDEASGAHVYGFPLEFINEQGEPAAYSGIATKAKTDDSEWEPYPFRIEWENGKVDYTFKLKEILVRKVSMLRLRPTRGDERWTFAAETSLTIASKDVADGPNANKAVQVTKLPKDTMLDTLALSPDGSHVLFSTLSEESNELKSRIFVQKTSGEGADLTPRALTDGRSLEITPAYTPDGSQVVFASNRAGRKLSIWSMSASEQPVPEQLTAGDSQDLWPSVDSNPKPRLFYQSLIDTRPDPRLFSTVLGANTRKDLSEPGGAQPRVAPTADAVLFTVVDPKTDKRDIFRMSDQGKEVTNLTNTPEFDEFDPAWSGDGLRIAFVSDRNRTPGGESPDNLDLYVMDAAAGSSAPVRVTHNVGWDDSPTWDVSSRALYFRSNRGGHWNVWRIELK